MIVVLQDVGFRNGEVPIEDVEEFTFNATYVASTEYRRT